MSWKIQKKRCRPAFRHHLLLLLLQVAIAYTLLTAVFLFGFYTAPDISWLQWLLVAGVGFSLYGPQMLIGLCGAEAVAKNAVSASQGFLGIISYAGNDRIILALLDP